MLRLFNDLRMVRLRLLGDDLRGEYLLHPIVATGLLGRLVHEKHAALMVEVLWRRQMRVV